VHALRDGGRDALRGDQQWRQARAEGFGPPCLRSCL
jgi:hypothetical protein